jgi:hypothetical protein
MNDESSWKGMQDPSLPPEVRSLILPYRMHGRAMLWARAMMRQRDRIISADVIWAADTEIDAALFAMSLRSLLRAVYAVRDLISSEEIGEAISRFDANVPNAIDIRDVLVHFDDYELGKGRIQNEARKRNCVVPYFWTWYQRTADNYVLRLGDSFQLDIEAATERALELAEATERALSKWSEQ